MRRAGRQAWAIAPALALVVGGLAGCLLELPSVCGDGEVDLSAEECDPAAEDDGPPCDPQTCRRMAVAVCGDGKLDPGEQCDTANFGNKGCPSGKGYLSCTADCQLDERTCSTCGNGRLDVEAGEECDGNSYKPGTVGKRTDCSGLSYPIKPYSWGSVMYCTPQCQWFRGPCGYCGDDEVDDAMAVDVTTTPVTLSSREICDGDAVRPEEREGFCMDNCPNQERGCTPLCAGKCDELVAPSLVEDLKCCLPKKSPCPAAGDPAPCCFGYDEGLADPFSADACGNFHDVDTDVIKRLCN